MSRLLDKIISAFSHSKTDARSRTKARKGNESAASNETIQKEQKAEEVVVEENQIQSANDQETALDDNCGSELDQYDYHLPERLIAQSPRSVRDHARMMVVDRQTGKISHALVRDILNYLRPEDAIVLNNTKVLPARLMGRRANTNGRWEGLFLDHDEHDFWEIMSKTRGKLRQGELIELLLPGGGGERFLRVVGHTAEKTLIVRPELEEGETTYSFLERVGWTPIPPYIRGGIMTPSDRDDYQTVYAKEPGAVAAPTAGLHFTKELLEQIEALGVAICPVTLHVGAGTFKPITATKLAEHHMHSEFASISEDTVRTLEDRKARGGRVVAIGTTSVRTLESASNARPDGTIDSSGNNDLKLRPFAGQTDLFIRPPYRFKTVDVMFTNFHLPKSTLIILTRAFGGDELIKRAYQEAIAEDYRFYSYGDSMLIL